MGVSRQIDFTSELFGVGHIIWLLFPDGSDHLPDRCHAIVPLHDGWKQAAESRMIWPTLSWAPRPWSWPGRTIRSNIGGDFETPLTPTLWPLTNVSAVRNVGPCSLAGGRRTGL